MIEYYNITMVLNIVLSIIVIIKLRGNSLLAWSSIAITLQAGIVFNSAFALAEKFGKTINIEAFENMGYSFIIFYVISIFYLIFELVSIKKTITSLGKINLNPFLLYILLFFTFLQLFYILINPINYTVIKNGFNIFGSEDYYDFRVVLLEEGNKNALTGFFARISNITYSFSLIGFLVLYYHYITSRDNSIKLFLYFVGFVVFLDALLKLEKAPVLILLLSVLIIKYSNKLAVLGKVKLILYSSLFFVFANFFALIVINYTQGVSFVDGLSFLYYRTFIVPSITSLMHFDVYPSSLPFVKFSNVSFIQKIFSLKNATMNGSIAIDVAMQKVGLYYSANANLVASSWAQWGYKGVTFVTFFTYLLFYTIDRYTNSIKRVVPLIPLVSFYCFWLIKFGNSAIENILLTSSLWFIPFIYHKFYKKVY